MDATLSTKQELADAEALSLDFEASKDKYKWDREPRVTVSVRLRESVDYELEQAVAKQKETKGEFVESAIEFLFSCGNITSLTIRPYGTVNGPVKTKMVTLRLRPHIKDVLTKEANSFRLSKAWLVEAAIADRLRKVSIPYPSDLPF